MRTDQCFEPCGDGRRAVGEFVDAGSGISAEDTLSQALAGDEDELRADRRVVTDGQQNLQRREIVKVFVYYPLEVSSLKYCCLGVFRKEYFRLITN